MVKIDFLDLEINEKIYKRIIIVGIILILGYLIITFSCFAFPKVYKVDSKTISDDENKVKTGISEIYRGNLKLRLSGFAYKEGENIKSFNSYYILKNTENGKMYKITAEMKDIPELNNIDENMQYSKGGMVSESFIIGIKKGIYDLYILYQNNDNNLLVNTGLQVNI